MREKRREFLKSVGVLAGGAAVAHGITAAALPVLSRLYTPSDFSALAVFAGLMSVCSVAAALRFDLAVPLPEREADSLTLVALGLLASIATALLVAIAVAVSSTAIAAAVQQPALAMLLWLLPLGVALSSAASVLQYWHSRQRQFSSIARSRLAQSSASAATQIGLGAIPLAPLGLLIGHVVSAGTACAWLGTRLVRESGTALRASASLARMRQLFGEYRQFPTFSTAEALANAASMHVPLILIAKYAIGPEAGYILLAMTVMQAPMSLVGAAVGQVYVSRAADEHRAGTLGGLTAEVAGQLARLGVGPIVAAGIAAPAGFALVFGADWERAGWLVACMMPWFVLQFLSAPMGLALHVTGHLRLALALQLGGLAIRVAAVIGAAYLALPIAESFAASGAVFYAVYLAVVLRVSGVRAADMLQGMRRALPAVALWALAGSAIALLLVWFKGT
jgi:O-antigen/teichoic acid export membrane protein